MSFESLENSNHSDHRDADRELDQALRSEMTLARARVDPESSVPTEIADLFRSEELRFWLYPGDSDPVPMTMKCENFWPRLYALILGEGTAARLVLDPHFQKVLERLVVRMSDLLGDEVEIGLVCYADIPPRGRSPNRPVMAITHNMMEWRQQTLSSRLAIRTHVNFAFTNAMNTAAIGDPIFQFPTSDPISQIMPRHSKATKVAGALAFIGLLSAVAGLATHFVFGGLAPLIVSAVCAAVAWAAAEFGRDTFKGNSGNSNEAAG